MAKEIFSAEDEELFKRLQAKKKRVQRAEADFLSEADKRKDELLSRWGASPMSDTYDSKWSDIMRLYGATDENDLYEFIIRERSIQVYQEKHLGMQEG